MTECCIVSILLIVSSINFNPESALSFVTLAKSEIVWIEAATLFNSSLTNLEDLKSSDVFAVCSSEPDTIAWMAFDICSTEALLCSVLTLKSSEYEATLADVSLVLSLLYVNYWSLN